MSTENKGADVKPEEKTLQEPPVGKPRVLILGGCGFIGRNLVKYLVDNKLASFIRVADKSLPATSYLGQAHKDAFAEKKIVEFKQADLCKDDHVARVFNEGNFNYVVNLCAETRFGLVETEYKIRSLDTANKCAAAAKKAGVSKWIEVSTAQVYKPAEKKPATEDAKIDPWTKPAQFRLMAEEAVKKDGPPSVILRPAIVYGPGDLTGLAPRICCAAVYKNLNEPMKFLWDENFRLNVVHVRDVCAAIWLAATELTPGSVYNLADPSDLTQGKLNEVLGKLFDIKTGYLGMMANAAAKVAISTTANYCNEKHVPVWTRLTSEHKLNTPLSPFLDKEILSNNNTFIDGSKIAKDSAGKFSYHPFSETLVAEQLDFAVKNHFMPEPSKIAVGGAKPSA